MNTLKQILKMLELEIDYLETQIDELEAEIEAIQELLSLL